MTLKQCFKYLGGLDYIGRTAQWDHVVLYTDPEEPQLLAYYANNGSVAVATGFGHDRDNVGVADVDTA